MISLDGSSEEFEHIRVYKVIAEVEKVTFLAAEDDVLSTMKRDSRLDYSS